MLDVAGNPSLMTTELKATLADHAAGNYRIMMNLADELLATAVERDLERLDEKLYLDLYRAVVEEVIDEEQNRPLPF